jgi:hypothetical protein
VVTAALEVQRRDKVIGASLEAAPVVHGEEADGRRWRAADGPSISPISASPRPMISADGRPPIPARRRGVPPARDPGHRRGVRAAEGEKCQRCWKILPDVGRHRASRRSAGAATTSSALVVAEKFGAFLGRPEDRPELLSWLFWQMGSAPYLGGGFGHFYAYAPYPMEYPINRFAMETKRQLDVLNRHLEGRTWMVGDDITIADMAIAPWYGRTVMGQSYNAGEFLSVHEYKNVIAWAERFYARPAVQRGARVNRTSDTPGEFLKERHDASDFDALDLPASAAE